MRLRNINPIGAVDFPLLRRTIGRGEVFDVDDELGNELLQQAGNYERADADSEGE